MQLVADYFPLLLFFIAFKLQGIWVATGVAIAASVVQIAWFWHRGRVSVVHWLSLIVIVVFGGATLILHDETFIKWKPTVLYLLFGSILAVGKLAFRRDLLAFLLKDIALPAPVWTRLTWAWVGFFAAMAAANWYVAFHYSLDTWATFKVWGGISLFLLFALAQGLVLARYMTEPTR
jgi:intracellular septation protein